MKKTIVCAISLIAGLIMAGCGGTTESGTAAAISTTTNAASSSPSTSPLTSSRAPSSSSPSGAGTVSLKPWPPTGYTEYGDEGVAWKWTPDADVDCEDWTDACWGITVATSSDCPGGVFLEISVLDKSGAAVDEANEITDPLKPGDIGSVTLAPPSGAKSDAQARFTKLNCLATR